MSLAQIDLPESAVRVKHRSFQRERFTSFHAIYNGSKGEATSWLLYQNAILSRDMIAEKNDEHIGRIPVKPAMVRARIALTILFPAVWLLAAAQSSSGKTSLHSISPAAAEFSSQLRSGHANSANPFAGADTAFRPGNARLFKHLNKPANSSAHCVPGSIRGEDSAFRNSFFLSLTRSTPLANRWQFDCRAALDPRAPSLAS